MNRKDILKMCIQNLKRRRSRTLLTLLGVLIGCCSIVIMVSIGIGMAESQNRMLAEMGDLTIITVTPKQNGKGKIKLNDSALGQIRHMEHVAAVTPKLNLEEYECTIRLYAGANDRYVAEWSTVAGIDIRELDRMGLQADLGAECQTERRCAHRAVPGLQFCRYLPSRGQQYCEPLGRRVRRGRQSGFGTGPLL